MSCYLCASTRLLYSVAGKNRKFPASRPSKCRQKRSSTCGIFSEQSQGSYNHICGRKGCGSVPWVQSLPLGHRLRLGGFRSQQDRDSLVLRGPAFQLHLRQTLQMRFTSLCPAYLFTCQRGLEILLDFASGLPLGLAELSILHVAAWGLTDYMVELAWGLQI